MDGIRKIERIEISDLFWKDLEKWRKTPEYRDVRKEIADMVLRGARGEHPGDRGFTADRWKGIFHMHLPAKLVVFTMYPEPGTMRLCALAKHDFYGFRRERKSLADNAARKVRQAAERPPSPSPEWSSLRWRDPAELVGHPEIPELSQTALHELYQQILDEQDHFEMFDRVTADMSPKMRDKFSEAWIASLIEAQAFVADELVARAGRRRDHLLPREMELWTSSPSP